MIYIILGIILVVVICSLKQINEYQRGILFTFGKFSKILNPGWHIVLPIVNFYKKIDEERPNEVVLQVFAKIISMEKDLKNIRNKYTLAVEKYNESLIKHKFMCLKVIRMKPLDTYKVMK